MSSSLTGKERVKLMIIDVDNFTDNEVWEYFLNLEFSNEDEINELCGCLDKHRPLLSAKMQKFFGI